MTMLTMFLIYPFTLSHEHRHHRHRRHAYSEMTLAVYYCSKQKQWYYEKHKIRMTQMTLMTLNLGYGIGISSKQRHKRHLRHYRHTRAARGSGVHPRNAFVDIQTLCLQNMSTPKTVTIKFDAHTNPYIPQSESTVDSLKIFNSSEWINDRFTLPTEAKCRKNPANSPRVNQFRFIQKSWLEKMNQFWFTLQLELVLQNEEKSLVYGLFLCRTH